MTEGAPAPFAVHGDVAARWRSLSTAEQEQATVRLGDASALLRTLVPGIDARFDADPNFATVVTAAVADAVIRFLRNPAGAKQLQESIGPRSYGMTFEGRASGIFFTDGELAPLLPTAGVNLTTQAIGTAYLGVRPGWAGIRRRRPWL